MDMQVIAISATALTTAVATAVKQIWDTKTLKKWICTRNPCQDRTKGEPPPIDALESKSS